MGITAIHLTLVGAPRWKILGKMMDMEHHLIIPTLAIFFVGVTPGSNFVLNIIFKTILLDCCSCCSK